ncbi:hypothetical protein [Bhargavaea beijingensis]|uniref:Uncharacterized protein n=1 Tax=Bhargavaea beijingensis TaxID=426756 RepID=A0A1G7CSN0_9BACL|nr:hypothetical protein [Bhargavaea beijingensis]MCW1927104.1 hypothetical protein [Bhargavaea beijingensis]RSK30830.1 hypothetical protein EJA12_08890 [Bhargavaea beijingensis]SDE42338.1 hypothetical protein SAMN04488126_108106 [Bhargavaea beijingensis]
MNLNGMIADLKRKSDRELRELALEYGIQLSSGEVRKLRPLLDEISFSFLWTGVPEPFIRKVESIIGPERTRWIMDQYL